ncbi:hypothetical protein P9209_02820 [Prescottella defluvii]|nr:hypothetical protein P9209_02820 [Prescottella defluvii]
MTLGIEMICESIAVISSRNESTASNTLRSTAPSGAVVSVVSARSVTVHS